MSSETNSPLSVIDSPHHMEQDTAPLTSSQKAEQATTRLRDRLANLAAQLTMAIDEEQNEQTKAQIRHQIGEVKADLETLEAVQAKFYPSITTKIPQIVTNTVVPKDLPLLQWTGNVWNDKRSVFSSVEECLDRFEDIVLANSQQLDHCWNRLLPLALSPEQRSWFKNNLRQQAQLPWSYVRNTLVRTYGINDAERQAQLTLQLMSMKMKKTESVATYTDRFQKTRREAGAADNLMTSVVYVHSLLPDLGKQVRLAQVNLPADQRCTVDQAASIARSLHSSIQAEGNEQDDSAKRGLSASRHNPANFHSNLHNSNESKGEKPRRFHKEKICKFHGKGNHSTEDCRILNTALSTVREGKISKNKYIGSKACFHCGKPDWTPRHTCKNKPEKPHFAVRSMRKVESGSSSSSAPAREKQKTSDPSDKLTSADDILMSEACDA